MFKHLGGKIAPELVYFVLKKELLNFSDDVVEYKATESISGISAIS